MKNTDIQTLENFIMLANSEKPKKATLRQKRIKKYLNAA